MAELGKAAILVPLMFVSLLAPSLYSSPSLAAKWTPTNSYPFIVDSSSCVVELETVYCIGGSTEGPNSPASSVEFAVLSPGGIGTWSETTDYPTPIEEQSCVATQGYVYCVGGFNGSSSTPDSYYAPFLRQGGQTNTAGVGNWTRTRSYPLTPWEPLSCVAFSGFIYCVGGFTSSAYFATLTAGGIGTWTKTTSYPFDVSSESCVTSFGYLYCVGGLEDNQRTDPVYFAPLSPSGIGAWTSSGNYPLDIGEGSCAALGPELICVGGSTNENPYGVDQTYLARFSTEGVGDWVRTIGYPSTIAIESCVTGNGFIFCIGGSHQGATSATYFSPVPTLRQF